jgi:hypothetical protein
MTKWQVDEAASWQNAKLMKRQVGEMKQQVDEITKHLME